jgi:hypothetical protein
MRYETPVLQEVGRATQLVLGFEQGHGDGAGANMSLVPAFALGLDE